MQTPSRPRPFAALVAAPLALLACGEAPQATGGVTAEEAAALNDAAAMLDNQALTLPEANDQEVAPE